LLVPRRYRRSALRRDRFDRWSGLRRWWWLLVVTIGTMVGQLFTSSTGWIPFHVFGSNFLEQVLIGATVLADWLVNEGEFVDGCPFDKILLKF